MFEQQEGDAVAKSFHYHSQDEKATSPHCHKLKPKHDTDCCSGPTDLSLAKQKRNRSKSLGRKRRSRGAPLPCAWRPSCPALPHAWRAAAEPSLKTGPEGPRRYEHCPSCWRCARPFAAAKTLTYLKMVLHSREAALKVVKRRSQGYWLGRRTGVHSKWEMTSTLLCTR